MRSLIMKGGTVAIIVMASGVAAGQKQSRPMAAVETTPSRTQAFLTPLALDHTSVASRLLSFDGNGDNRIARDELPERMEGLVSRGDTNQDGFVTRAEVIALVGKAAPAQRIQRVTVRSAASLAEIIADLTLPPITHARAMEIAKEHSVSRTINDPAWRDLHAAMRAVLDDEDYDNFVAAVARVRSTSRVSVVGFVGGVAGTPPPPRR